MTIFLNHCQQTIATTPLYIEGQSEPVEMIPDVELRLTLNIDVALHVANPKLAAITELARSLSSLLEDAERAEKDKSSFEWPVGHPYISKTVTLGQVDKETTKIV